MDTERRAPAREVHCEDAVAWMEARGPIEGASVVTSLPDVSELAPMTLAAWRPWFARAATLALSLCAEDGVAIFYQSDVVVDGEWIDKGHLVQCAAEAAGARLWWHRIVCRAPPGTETFGRPTFAHMLCFGRAPTPPPPRARVDVLPETGGTTWSRATGIAACADACRYVLARTPSRVVVDPFCGEGTVLAVANALGLDAIGVEIARRRARRSRTLRITADQL